METSLMRSKEKLQALMEIQDLITYLYSDETAVVVFSNGWIELQLRINENLQLIAQNRFMEKCPEMIYDSMMDLITWLEIIEQLKAQPSTIGLKSRWEEIQFKAKTSKTINRIN